MSREIIDKLFSLRLFIQSELPTCKVIISTLTFRSNNGKRCLKIRHLNELLRNLDIDIVDNGNISGEHVGRKGHHLNARVRGRLNMNIISCIRRL